MEEMLAYTQTEDCYAHWSKTQRKHYKANELRLGKIKKSYYQKCEGAWQYIEPSQNHALSKGKQPVNGR